MKRKFTVEEKAENKRIDAATKEAQGIIRDAVDVWFLKNGEKACKGTDREVLQLLHKNTYEEKLGREISEQQSKDAIKNCF